MPPRRDRSDLCPRPSVSSRPSGRPGGSVPHFRGQIGRSPECTRHSSFPEGIGTGGGTGPHSRDTRCGLLPILFLCRRRLRRSRWVVKLRRSADHLTLTLLSLRTSPKSDNRLRTSTKSSSVWWSCTRGHPDLVTIHLLLPSPYPSRHRWCREPEVQTGVGRDPVNEMKGWSSCSVRTSPR